MKTHAVFVDAGYFLAEGSKLIYGERQRQHELFLEIDYFRKLFTDNVYLKSLNINVHSKVSEKIKAYFTHTISNLTDKSELLRIYWYDGIPRSGDLNKPQLEIAESNNFKFRFGYKKEHAQKRVDSLMVTDIVELARNKSVSDIFLLAGDEDHIIGLELAQTYGVRVHLVSIASEIGKNYDEYLRREADSFHLLDKEIMTYLLELRKP